ncbi:hypothetical protein LTR53_020357, partial [Teratosphaeriaceae sp. CCFEE 6253]
MPRKKKGKGKQGDGAGAEVPAMPMLAADIIAARGLKAPAGSSAGPRPHPQPHPHPPFSDAASIRSDQSAKRRFFKTAAAKYTDQLARP